MNALLVLCAIGGLAWAVSPRLRRESPVVRLVVITFYVSMLARYILWRIWNLPGPKWSAAVLASYMFLGIEALATFLLVKDLLLFKRTKNRSADVQRDLDWYGDIAPRVDLLITTFNEPWEVLEKTVVAASSQNYPNYRAWILDDGNRAWLREKASLHGVGYVTRSFNTHYKAGNLNHGIEQLRASGIDLEFIALLDADFVAQPEFLRRTMALMKTPDVGIVQTPQWFYNPDPHQQAFGGAKCWPDEQRAWFDLYLPCLDARGSAACCGTSCLIRMTALDKIGGFPTVSVCEDTLTSIKMAEQHWRTVYLQERLTLGLAPEGIGEFLTQRSRWTIGGVQNTRHCGPGAGIGGRFNYWLALWGKAIWGIMPPLWVGVCIVYWFTGVSLIQVTTFEAAISYFGALWLARLFHGWLSAGRQQVFVSDALSMLMSPLWLVETVRAVMGSKTSFRVTDKAQHRDHRVVHWRLLPFHGTLILLLVAGMIYTALDPAAPTHHAGLFQAATVLSFWFILVMLAALAPIIEPPKRRASERYATSESIEAIVDGSRMFWRCEDISLDGVRLKTDGCAAIPPTIELRLHGIGAVRADLVRMAAPGSAAFAFRSSEARPALIRRLYCTDAYIVAPEHWRARAAVWSFFKRLLF